MQLSFRNTSTWSVFTVKRHTEVLIFTVAEEQSFAYSTTQCHLVSMYVRTCNSPEEQHQSEQLLQADRSPALLLWASMTWRRRTIPQRPRMYVWVYIQRAGSGFGRYMEGRVTYRISCQCLHSDSAAASLWSMCHSNKETSPWGIFSLLFLEIIKVAGWHIKPTG